MEVYLKKCLVAIDKLFVLAAISWCEIMNTSHVCAYDF